MEKPWFPQRNLSDTSIALLKSFIYHIGVKVSQPTIENDTKAHKEFPYLSVVGLKEIIAKWGIQSMAFTWEMDKISELPPLSILFIHDKEGNIKSGQFVMFYGVEGNSIEYLHPRKGWIIEDLNEFEKKWSKATLAVTEISETNGEPDFEEKENAYNESKYKNPELKNILIKDNFLTEEECEYIMNLANPVLKRSTLMGEKNIEGHGRTSYSAEFHVFSDDEVLDSIRKRAAEILKMPESHFEFFQCVSYDPKQEYQNHYDTFDETSERGKKAIEEGGQRKYTMLAYLNDDFDGGATYFPNVDVLVHPKKKRVVIFNNLDDDGKVIKTAFHAGLPVTKGRKYAVNIWVREKPVRN